MSNDVNNTINNSFTQWDRHWAQSEALPVRLVELIFLREWRAEKTTNKSVNGRVSDREVW